jgi:queuine tRNA-ribosyltransferase
MHLPHREIETPAFMPVGTQGAIKTLSAAEVWALGYRLILANTYHLALRPGEKTIERLGGLHAFMGWDGAILTDSGGYQVMSLAKRRKITDAGVEFQSHVDGAALTLSPERSVEIQAALGVDISMALDVCPPFPATRDEVLEAMRLTHLWAPRNLAAKRDSQAVFGITQGGVHEDLRRESAEFLSSLAFDGYAIGGVSVGEPEEMQRPVVEMAAPRLPDDKPRYLMGVGRPKDILHAIACGVDLFDCVLPTRMARHGVVFTLEGEVNVTNAMWTEHAGPWDEASMFIDHSAAYIRHLFKSEEPLGARLATLHNLAFYARLIEDARNAIREGTWTKLEEKYEHA